MIDLYLAPRLGHLPLARLAPPAIDALYVRLIEQDRLAPATVRQCGRILHCALQSAMRGGLITRNPCDATTLPRVPRYAPTILTAEKIAAYLADAHQTGSPAHVALSAIVRRSTLLACQWVPQAVSQIM